MKLVHLIGFIIRIYHDARSIERRIILYQFNLCSLTVILLHGVEQRFSTAGPRPRTGPWHQLYRAPKGSPGICYFSFLSNFHE